MSRSFDNRYNDPSSFRERKRYVSVSCLLFVGTYEVVRVLGHVLTYCSYICLPHLNDFGLGFGCFANNTFLHVRKV